WSYKLALEADALKVEKCQEPGADGHFYISGKIDRVDGDGQGNLVVLDYKSGSSSAQNFNSWFDKNQLQLLFYIWALEMDPDKEGEVAGAFYYIFKTMQRHSGMGLRERGENLFAVDRNYKSLTDAETKKELLENLEKLIVQVMEKIRQGHFPPDPRDKNDCAECNWRALCR